MISTKIKKLRNKFNIYKIDGYVVPKNDSYFNEYSSPDRLKFISNFDGSAGLAIILKKKNYLFVDGRYTLQAKKQSGKKFDVLEIPYTWPKNIVKITKRSSEKTLLIAIYNNQNQRRYIGVKLD